jgi:hypothetical protein
MKEKKIDFWDFFKNSYLPQTRLGLDIIYTVGFLKRRPMHIGDFNTFGNKKNLEGFYKVLKVGVYGIKFWPNF